MGVTTDTAGEKDETRNTFGEEGDAADTTDWIVWFVLI